MRAVSSNWHGLEADFIEQFLERRALRLQSPVQRAVMHQQKPGDLIAGRALGEEQDSQAAAQLVIARLTAASGARSLKEISPKGSTPKLFQSSARSY